MRYFCNFLGQFLNLSLMDDNPVLQCLNPANLISATLTATEPMEGLGVLLILHPFGTGPWLSKNRVPVF